MTRFGGVILCGGQSSRMGTPKEWLPFGEEVLLQRVVRVVRSVVTPVVVVAGRESLVPTLPDDVQIVRDTDDYRGPLHGLAQGLQSLGDSVDAVYLSACDVPLLRPAFVRRVCDGLGLADVALPYAEGWHPLAGVYRVGLLPMAQVLLQLQKYRLMALAETARVVTLTTAAFAEVDPELESLRNVNTPDEYQAVLTRVSTV